MKIAIALLLAFSVSCLGQVPAPGSFIPTPTPVLPNVLSSGIPQELYQNVVRITNNTVPANTVSAPLVSKWGWFVGAIYVTSGPCIAAGGIHALPTVSSGGTGYVTGDEISINGGTVPYYIKVNAPSGVVTSLNQGPVKNPFVSPFGAGYSTGAGIATTTVTGSGTGLTVNITSVFTGSAGPNCAWLQDTNSTGGWASASTLLLSCNNASCSNGNSFTLTPSYPAPPALAISGTLDFEGSWGSPYITVATPGSGQTPGYYLSFVAGSPLTINNTGTGATTSKTYALEVTPAGTVTQAYPVIVSVGAGYTSCPTLAIAAGGTPATFNCTMIEGPVWTFDTSMPAATSYTMQFSQSLAIGLAKDQAGNVWQAHPEGYNSSGPQGSLPTSLPWDGSFYGGGPAFVAIQKSTDKGRTWGPETPMLMDPVGSPKCGPGSNTLPCGYVLAGMATASDGTMVGTYWVQETGADYFANFPGQSGFSGGCCFVTRCNPNTADCGVQANWATYEITGNSPLGNPWKYDLEMQITPSGYLFMGFIDNLNYVFILVSCDNGVSFNSGLGCPTGLPTIFQLADPADGFNSLPTQEYWVVCYTNCSSATNATYILIDRNNYRNWSNLNITNTQSSGGVATYTFTGTFPYASTGTWVSIAGTTNGGGAFNVRNAFIAPGNINQPGGTFTLSVPFGNYASQAETGVMSYTIYPQSTGGAPIFGYSTNSGLTWTLAETYLTPYAPIASGDMSMAGTYLIDTGVKAPSGNDYFTFSWIERDNGAVPPFPSESVWMMTSTIDPAIVIANLSSWTNAYLQPLWLYSLGPQPSTPVMLLTGPKTVSMYWQANPASSSGGWGFWWSYSTFRNNVWDTGYKGFYKGALAQ